MYVDSHDATAANRSRISSSTSAGSETVTPIRVEALPVAAAEAVGRHLHGTLGHSKERCDRGKRWCLWPAGQLKFQGLEQSGLPRSL